MNTDKLYTNSMLAVIIVTALTRLTPHWPNFTPVVAVALVGGALLSKRWLASITPLAAMVLSDLALGLVYGDGWAWHGTTLYVYGSVALATFIGWSMRNTSPMRQTLVGGILASVLFFLITNFGVWYGSSMYSQDLSGLTMCYAAGLAFYENSGNFLLNGVVSTWMFMAALFGASALIRRRVQRAVAQRSTH
ncbi:MAG TPA: hypothetical protein DIS79_03245 [Bacteroidetes bacterium]|nr:hypothetical protein [Bacteroidota bacterium]